MVLHYCRSAWTPASGLWQKLTMVDGPSQQRHEETATASPRRDAILAASADLFNAKGYHDTRLSDVADRLGLVKTTISYHFQSKEALLFQLYQNTCEAAERDLREASFQPTGRDAIAHWLKQIAERQTASLSGAHPPLATLSDISALGQDQRHAVAARVSQQFSAIRQMLQRGNADGSLRVRSPDASAFFLFCCQDWLRNWLSQVPYSAIGPAVPAFCDLLMNGLAAERHAPLAIRSQPPATQDFSTVFDRETRSRMKREAFLRAGTRLLNEHGYRNLSLNALAAELGVSRSAFYYYIADKDALLEQCVDRSINTLARAQAFGESSAETGLMRLANTLRSVFDGHISDLDPLIRSSLLHAMPDGKMAVAQARHRALGAGFGKMIAEGVVDGSMRPTSISTIEHIVMGALLAASRRQLSLSYLASSPTEANANVAIAAMAYFEPIIHGLANERDHDFGQ